MLQKYHISHRAPISIPDDQFVLQVGEKENATYLTISKQRADEFGLWKDLLKEVDQTNHFDNLKEEPIIFPVFEEFSLNSVLALLEWTSNSPSVTDPLVFILANFLDFRDQTDLYRKNLEFIFQLDPTKENLAKIYDHIYSFIPYREYKKYITKDNPDSDLFLENLLRTPELNPMEAYNAIKNTSEQQQAEFRQKYFIRLDKIGEDGIVPPDKPYIVISHDQIWDQDPKGNTIFNLNPDKVAVIDFGNQTQIPDEFLCKTSLKNIIIEGPQITTIGSRFFLSCHNLTTLDLSGLSNVTSIGDAFLTDCSRLTSIDLSPLSNVTSIGDNFLLLCTGLTSINLSPLSKVTSIGNKFLSSCTSLTSVDLFPLSKLTSIGDHFLSDCTGLTKIDLSDLSKVTSIGDHFLRNCYALTSIDLSGLSGVTSIGNEFLNNCPGLTSINLSPLSKVTSISNDFLSRCTGLTSIDLSPLSKATSIGSDFLSKCFGLTKIDLSGLSGVTSIGDNFLSDCYDLTAIDLSPLSNVTSIGDNFLFFCTGLASVDLSPLRNVTSIGNWFLSHCTNLTSIDLSPLSKITSIGDSFLYNCNGLTEVNLSSLRNLVEVRDLFLYDNTEARILVSDERMKNLIKDKNPGIDDSRFVIVPSSTNTPVPPAQ